MQRLTVANAAVWNGERAIEAYRLGDKGLKEYIRYITNADRCWTWIRLDRRKAKKPRNEAS